mmetsp:Transcript_21830/g.49715  ORF Transcript_21830/g.49715 Transcript_21830/m.49715 type:complete len:278 (+) Transcript_21830:408-1241(+)
MPNCSHVSCAGSALASSNSCTQDLWPCRTAALKGVSPETPVLSAAAELANVFGSVFDKSSAATRPRSSESTAAQRSLPPGWACNAKPMSAPPSIRACMHITFLSVIACNNGVQPSASQPFTSATLLGSGPFNKAFITSKCSAAGSMRTTQCRHPLPSACCTCGSAPNSNSNSTTAARPATHAASKGVHTCQSSPCWYSLHTLISCDAFASKRALHASWWPYWQAVMSASSFLHLSADAVGLARRLTSAPPLRRAAMAFVAPACAAQNKGDRHSPSMS